MIAPSISSPTGVVGEGSLPTIGAAVVRVWESGDGADSHADVGCEKRSQRRLGAQTRRLYLHQHPHGELVDAHPHATEVHHRHHH